MGITISALPITQAVTAASTATSGTASGTTAATAGTESTTTGGSLQSGFAALFSGQLSLITAQGLTQEKAANIETTGKQSDTESDLLADPGLAFIMAPHIAVTKTPQDAGKDSDEGSLGFNLKGGGTQLATELSSKDQSLPETITETIASSGKFSADLSDAKLQTESKTANIAGDLSASTAITAPTAHTNATSTHSTTQTEVATPLRDSHWPQNFSEKIVWMAKSDQQSAQINLNPPQLGPVQVTLQLNGDQANAVFASPHAEVRQAIQESLPQLKEMFAAAGINLGQADIGANLAQQNRETPFQTANGQRSSDETAILAGNGNTTDSTASTPIQRGRGMVDLFA